MTVNLFRETAVLFYLTNMEFRANGVISLVIVAASFVGLINSVCVIDKQPTSNIFRYHCLKSTDYVSDANRAPIDIKFVIFSISNITKIDNAVFTRFSQTLMVLEIVSSRVREIDDKAFQGFIELREINLAGNELEVVKEAWFKNIPKLESISLSHNKIQHIEDGFFLTVSPLKQLAISHNELTCISESALSTLTVEEISFDFNQWSWECLSNIVDSFKQKNTKYTAYSYDGWYLAGNVTKNCIAKSPYPQPEDNFINNCVRTAISQWIPSVENYTALHVCAMPNESPFLWCGRRKSV